MSSQVNPLYISNQKLVIFNELFISSFYWKKSIPYTRRCVINN